MSLKWPYILLFSLIPTAIILWQRYRKPIRKPDFIAESAALSKLPSYKKITKRAKKFRIIERSLLALTMAGLLILAARPVMPVSSYNEEKSRDIVILLDVSGSMNEYIPTLLDVVERIYKENPGERYSIVAFKGMYNVVLPLTRDKVAFEEKIELLRQVYQHDNDPNYQFSGTMGFGTDIGEGVLGAVNRFTNLERYKSRNVILLSDLANTGGEMDPNSEFYLEKVSLLPKYRINFYVLRTPPEFDFEVSHEIPEIGGAKVFDIDKSNSSESINSLSNEIFNQILNTETYVSKNLMDYPGPLLFIVILFAGLWVGSMIYRWRKT